MSQVVQLLDGVEIGNDLPCHEDVKDDHAMNSTRKYG